MLKGFLKKKNPCNLNLWQHLPFKEGRKTTNISVLTYADVERTPCFLVSCWRGWSALWKIFPFLGKITPAEICAQPSLKSFSRAQYPGRRKGRWMCRSAAGKHTLMESQTWTFCISKMSRKQPKSEWQEPGGWDKLLLQTQNTAAYSFILWGPSALTK